MDNLDIWEHKYNLGDKVLNYKVKLVNYDPEDYNPEDPSDFLKIRDQLDKHIADFLNEYQTNPLIPMKVEIMGKAFTISMDVNNEISVEKMHEIGGRRGY